MAPVLARQKVGQVEIYYRTSTGETCGLYSWISSLLWPVNYFVILYPIYSMQYTKERLCEKLPETAWQEIQLHQPGPF